MDPTTQQIRDVIAKFASKRRPLMPMPELRQDLAFLVNVIDVLEAEIVRLKKESPWADLTCDHGVPMDAGDCEACLLLTEKIDHLEELEAEVQRLRTENAGLRMDGMLRR